MSVEWSHVRPPPNQGLGLLINLVEYSSRNRHSLVDMEYSVDESCLEDSLLQLAEPGPASAPAQGDRPASSGALAALVKVAPQALAV